MSWANQELLQTLALWLVYYLPITVFPRSSITKSRFLPLIPNFTNPALYNESAVEAGKLASLNMLDTLEEHLKSRTYLVGRRITLADIMVAVFVSRGLEWVLDAEWRAKRQNIMRHFEMVSSWGPVKTVIPSFVLVEKETQNVNPN